MDTVPSDIMDLPGMDKQLMLGAVEVISDDEDDDGRATRAYSPQASPNAGEEEDAEMKDASTAVVSPTSPNLAKSAQAADAEKTKPDAALADFDVSEYQASSAYHYSQVNLRLSSLHPHAANVLLYNCILAG